MAAQPALGRGTLEGGEAELPMPVERQQTMHEALAQTTLAVEEQDGADGQPIRRARGRRGRHGEGDLRRILYADCGPTGPTASDHSVN